MNFSSISFAIKLKVRVELLKTVLTCKQLKIVVIRARVADPDPAGFECFDRICIRFLK